MAAINVPFVNVIVHQPGKEAQDPVPVVMLNQKLHLKGLEQALGLQRLRIITAEHPQGIFLTADNDGLINLDPLAPGSSIEVYGELAPGVAGTSAVADSSARKTSFKDLETRFEEWFYEVIGRCLLVWSYDVDPVAADRKKVL